MNKLRFWWILLLLSGAGIILSMMNCGDDTPAQTKNRVPTMQEQTDAAQKAVQDAQIAAKQAQDAAAAMKQNQTDGGVKVEHTGFGRVTDVTEVWEAKDQSTWGDAYIAFTFVEETGFSKKFYPTCAEQTIPAGKVVALNYHWGESGHIHGRGCFMIDGYTVKQ